MRRTKCAAERWVGLFIFLTAFILARNAAAVIGIPFGNVKGAENLEKAGEFAKALEARELTAEFCEYFSIPEFEDDLEFYRKRGNLRYGQYVEEMLSQFREWAKVSREKAEENRAKANLPPEQVLRYRQRIRRQLMGAADLYPEIHNGQLGVPVLMLERDGVTAYDLERAAEGRERSARLYEKVSIPYALHATALARMDGDLEEVKQLEARLKTYRAKFAENAQKAKEDRERAALLQSQNQPERLRTKLNDPDARTRRTAIDAADALGRLEVLYAGLSSDYPDTRMRAFEALERKLDIRGLLYAKFSNDAEVAARATKALGRNDPLFRSVVVERSVDALNDEAYEIRTDAHRVLMTFAGSPIERRSEQSQDVQRAAAAKWRDWLKSRLKPGLFGVYYQGQDFNEMKTVRVDAKLDFHWEESPHPDVSKGRYSIRWIGKLEVLETQKYRIFTYNDDGVRVWINHRKVIDDWNQHTPAPQEGEIALEAGLHDISIEFFNGANDATLQLFWATDETPQAIIPPERLWHYELQIED